jgi:hypothetical protein
MKLRIRNVLKNGRLVWELQRRRWLFRWESVKAHDSMYEAIIDKLSRENKLCSSSPAA